MAICKYITKYASTDDLFKLAVESKNKLLIRFTKSPYKLDVDDDDLPIICKYLGIIISMILSVVNYTVDGLEEGTKKTVVNTTYERNPINRELCLLAKGYTCSVCGFNFSKKYGEIGEGYIEVHHLTPVSQLGDHYVIDPINDLAPVCSNCHSILHRKNPPYTIEELQGIVKDVK